MKKCALLQITDSFVGFVVQKNNDRKINCVIWKAIYSVRNYKNYTFFGFLLTLLCAKLVVVFSLMHFVIKTQCSYGEYLNFIKISSYIRIPPTTILWKNFGWFFPSKISIVMDRVFRLFNQRQFLNRNFFYYHGLFAGM